MTDTFWALVGLVLFLALLAYLKVPGWIGRSLDVRARRISDELEEARRLREEAQKLLEEYQQKRHEVEKIAADIVGSAQREADLLTQEAKRKTQDYIKRREKLVELKIAQVEQDVIAEVRAKAVDIAVKAATKLIAEEVIDEKSASFFQSSLDEVRTRLN